MKGHLTLQRKQNIIAKKLAIRLYFRIGRKTQNAQNIQGAEPAAHRMPKKEADMESVGVLEAKNSLSSLLAKIESGEQDCIVIRKHGKPIAKIVPCETTDAKSRIGLLAGKYTLDGGWDSDAMNETIAQDFPL